MVIPGATRLSQACSIAILTLEVNKNKACRGTKLHAFTLAAQGKMDFFEISCTGRAGEPSIMLNDIQMQTLMNPLKQLKGCTFFY